ncbi:MAG TPA: phosphatase PAP2 family protein [Acidimicrobiales bacterium]|nr:phosphatase PAP2 family protein [Acidimicrobiales bacterium]
MTTTDRQPGLRGPADEPALTPETTETTGTGTVTGAAGAAAPAPAEPTLPHQRRTLAQWLSDRWSDPGRRRVTIGWIALAASVAVYYVVAGIPWSTNSVLVYVMAGLVISSLGSGVKWKRLLLDWLPLIAVLFIYGLLRGYAAHTIWGPFYRPQDWFDTHVFGGLAPTVQLQRWLYTPGLHVWDYLVWTCYMSHFFVSFIVAGVLWKINHRKFRRFVPLFVGLTFIGYITYVLYPAMPPWMSSQFGHLPPTTRIIDQVWKHLHLGLGASLFAGGDKFDNNVAAMPSLHGAYPMLICLFFWKGSSVRKRVLLAAYPVCMAFSLVYTGEHFVIDILVGWLYAAATFYVGSKLLDRWEARRLRKSLAPGGADRPLESTIAR